MKIRFSKIAKEDVLFGVIGALLVHSITTEIELKKQKERTYLQNTINRQVVEAFQTMDKRMDQIEKDLDDVFIARGIDRK